MQAWKQMQNKKTTYKESIKKAKYEIQTICGIDTNIHTMQKMHK